MLAAAALLALSACVVEQPPAGDTSSPAAKPSAETSGSPAGDTADGIKVPDDDEGGGAELAKYFDAEHADADWYPHITEISQFAKVRLITTDLHKVTEADAKRIALAICDAAFDHLGRHKAEADGLTINRADDGTTITQFTFGPGDKKDCWWMGINGSAEPSR